MKKKILYLQPAFDTHGPRNIRTENIVKYLKLDYDIHIITFNCYAEQKKIEGVTIHRLEYSGLSKYILNKELSGYRPTGLVKISSRLLSFFLRLSLKTDVWEIEQSNVLKYINEKLLENRFDFIIASIFPFSNSYLSKKIKSNFFNDSKVIFDIGDPYSNNSADTNIGNNKKKVKKEITMLSFAEQIIVTNEDTKNYYINKLNVTVPIHVIPQGVDTDLFTIKDNEKQKSKKIKLVYAGTFYKILRDPSNFFEVIEKFNNDIEVNIFGGKYTVSPSIDCVTFNERVTPEKIAQEFQNSDILLYFDNAFGIQTSGKIYELLAMRKVILFIYDYEKSPVIEMTKAFSNVIQVKNEREEIFRALKELIKAPSQIYTIYNYDVSVFSWKNRAEMMSKLLTK